MLIGVLGARVLRRLPGAARVVASRHVNCSLNRSSSTNADQDSNEERLIGEVLAAVHRRHDFYALLHRKVASEIKPNKNEGGDDVMSLADFFAMDKDKDGAVDQHEFRAWYKQRFPDGLQYAQDGATDDASVTRKQLWRVALQSGIPFVGFGFLDNSIMLVAGGQIEAIFGTTLGLSALAAAALGNTLSDVLGLQAGGVVERIADRMGLPDPNLSIKQMKMTVVRRVRILSNVLGIVLGCFLGMFPLLFMSEKEERLKQVFREADVDGSGEIEIRELSNAVLKIGLSFSKDQLIWLFNEFDSNGDHKISFQEFRTLVQAWEEVLEAGAAKKTDIPDLGVMVYVVSKEKSREK